MFADDKVTLPGWERGRYRIMAGQPAGWRSVDGWVRAGFGMKEATVETIYGDVDLVAVTHLESGLRLMLTEELTGGVVAADIAETVLPDDWEFEVQKIGEFEEPFARALNEVGFAWSGVTNRAGAAIWHLAREPRSDRLLSAAIRHEINVCPGGRDLFHTIASAIAARHPVLTAGRPALAEMVKQEFYALILEEAVMEETNESFARAGITEQMRADKINQCLKRAGGDHDKAKALFTKWMMRIGVVR